MSFKEGSPPYWRFAIILAGKHGSGCTTAAQYLKNELNKKGPDGRNGYAVLIYDTRAIANEICRLLGLPVYQTIPQAFHDGIAHFAGPDGYRMAVREQFLRLRTDVAIYDRLVSVGNTRYFRKSSLPLVIAHIRSDDSQRLGRCQPDHGIVVTESLEKLVTAAGEVEITNNGELVQMHQQLDELVLPRVCSYLNSI